LADRLKSKSIDLRHYLKDGGKSMYILTGKQNDTTIILGADEDLSVVEKASKHAVVETGDGVSIYSDLKIEEAPTLSKRHISPARQVSDDDLAAA
jgi:uncharacterized Zn ribbon protein